MKRFVVMTAGSLALLAGNVFAGGCIYGQKAAMADAHDAVQEPVTEEGLNPELLARLKEQEKESLEKSLVVVPDIHN